VFPVSADPDPWPPRFALRFWDWRDRPGFFDAADASDVQGDAAEPERAFNGEN
jgi:hypothetical protein